jgi:hypothetical protein
MIIRKHQFADPFSAGSVWIAFATGAACGLGSLLIGSWTMAIIFPLGMLFLGRSMAKKRAVIGARRINHDDG